MVHYENMRYMPEVTEKGDETGTEIVLYNNPQRHYTDDCVCQMCNGQLDRDSSVHSRYKKKNLCGDCRSHTSVFLHLQTRWVFKFCNGCSKVEHISQFETCSSSSCMESQMKRTHLAQKRRVRTRGGE
jgi:hypothetical protein